MDQPNEPTTPKVYELKLRLLGNEVFAIGLVSSSDSNKWIAIGIVSVFSVLTVLGAYGEKLVQFYQSLVG